MQRDSRFAQAVELTTATYDRIAENYAQRNENMGRHWLERMETFVDMLADFESAHPIPEVGRPADDVTLEDYLQLVPVLDAGCGHGRDARNLAANGQHVLAIDLSQGMLDVAAERTARKLPRGSIHYALMDMRHLELPDACCRGVWCSAALLHIPMHRAPLAVNELVRVARRGAPFVFFLKQRRDGQDPEQIVPYGNGDQPDLPRFYAYYTLDEARALFEDAGLTVIDSATVADRHMHDAPGWISYIAQKP